MKKSLVSVILVASMMLSIGGCGLKKKMIQRYWREIGKQIWSVKK